MRKATVTELKRNRSLTREDMLECFAPDWVRQQHWPVGQRYIPQVTYKGYIKGAIRGVNHKTHEVLVDLGFHDAFWINADDEAPTIDKVAIA